MAGHSHAKNVMHQKSAMDAKKAKVFTKIAKAIKVAVRLMNDNNEETNPRLRQVLKMAQNANVPKDIIKRALFNDNSNKKFEEIIYEGYGPNGLAVLVKVLTDNKNKTASEIRTLFNKHNINIAEPNSVAFLFKNLSVIECIVDNYDAFLEKCLELNAVDVFENIAYFQAESLHIAQTELEKHFKILNAELAYVAENLIEETEEKQAEILKIIEKLEEDENVQNCWHNYKFQN